MTVLTFIAAFLLIGLGCVLTLLVLAIRAARQAHKEREHVRRSVPYIPDRD